MRCYVLMGVSGCGKSSVGEALADQCNVTFIDGDDLHPKTNIEKMASGIPLTDADRAPWLEAVGEALAASSGPSVIGCSALKLRYRDLIRSRVEEPVSFIHLHADQRVLEQRVNEREGHFMPPALLQSQYDALEELEPDELGVRIDISQPLTDVIGDAARYVKETMI